jgi:carbonic anhydrase
MKIKIFTIIFLLGSFFIKDSVANTNVVEDLKSGNDHYVSGHLRHPRQDSDRRKEVSKAQGPKAVILSCSDSRVPPEIVFDQGVGDLFVVRVAGNVLNEENLGSIEYAIEHLGVKNIVVMGHSRCGAVTAAVGGVKAHGHVKSIISELLPAVREAKKRSCNKCDLVEVASHINVANIVKKLRSIFKIDVVGAYYDLDSGKVTFLETDRAVFSKIRPKPMKTAR